MSGGMEAACVEIEAALERHRGRVATERVRQRTELRRRARIRQIDDALEECERVNLASTPPTRKPATPGVVDLILRLQAASGLTARRPQDSVDAHEMLCHLQRRYLLASPITPWKEAAWLAADDASVVRPREGLR